MQSEGKWNEASFERGISRYTTAKPVGIELQDECDENSAFVDTQARKHQDLEAIFAAFLRRPVIIRLSFLFPTRCFSMTSVRP